GRPGARALELRSRKSEAQHGRAAGALRAGGLPGARRTAWAPLPREPDVRHAVSHRYLHARHAALPAATVRALGAGRAARLGRDRQPGSGVVRCVRRSRLARRGRSDIAPITGAPVARERPCMKAIRAESPGAELALREVAIPRPGPGE